MVQACLDASSLNATLSLYVLSCPFQISTCTWSIRLLGGVFVGSMSSSKMRTSGSMAQMNSPAPKELLAMYSPISHVVLAKVSALLCMGCASYVCLFSFSICPWKHPQLGILLLFYPCPPLSPPVSGLSSSRELDLAMCFSIFK